MAREIEAKIALQAGEMDRMRRRLFELGASPGPLDEEENLIFDLKLGRHTKKRVRLRRFGGRADGFLTFKRPVESNRFKMRDEYEIHVSDARSAGELLHELGFRHCNAYQKLRENWEVGETLVTLDQLAFGDFVEVEGEPPAIEQTLVLLGLSRRPHEPRGYSALARKSTPARPKTRWALPAWDTAQSGR
jgi:predicted adenylyl cyclase CyaB